MKESNIEKCFKDGVIYTYTNGELTHVDSVRVLFRNINLNKDQKQRLIKKEELIHIMNEKPCK